MLVDMMVVADSNNSNKKKAWIHYHRFIVIFLPIL